MDISADTIVAVAPPESVITTLLFEKSIPDSFIISFPASTELLSVPFKTILSYDISSSNNIFSLSSCTNTLPKSSVLILSPSSPVLPDSMTAKFVEPSSWYLFITNGSPTLCDTPPSMCPCSIIKLPPDIFGPSVALPNVWPLSCMSTCVPLFLPVASSNNILSSPVLPSALITILSSIPLIISGLVKTSNESPIPEWLVQ